MTPELAFDDRVSRDTIHRWIRDGNLDRDLEDDPVRCGPRATALDAYKPIIGARLEAYPELSTVRLFDEIRAAGYVGYAKPFDLLVGVNETGDWRARNGSKSSEVQFSVLSTTECNPRSVVRRR